MLNMENILFVGAHPDDIEVGCGGTIKKLSMSGKNIFSIIATRGEKSGDPKTKVNELYQSFSNLGILRENTFILDLQDSMISDDSTTISKIEDILKKINPDMIFVTPNNDKHQDHRNISNSTIVAARNLKKCSILLYETISSENFLPKMFVDVTDSMNDKLNSLKSYQGLNDKVFDFVSSAAKFRGHQSKCDYAEGFEINKIFLDV